MEIENTEGLSVEEALDELNDFDEDNMEKHFKVGVTDMEKREMKFMRALVWVTANRNNPKFTYTEGRKLRIKEIKAYFPELNEEVPTVTDDQGKDESTSD